jgi:hypothetical protein
MKLKITDEKLDELIFKKGLVFKSCFAEGFRAAESHHQATVDKLIEIIEMQRKSLSKIILQAVDIGLCDKNNCCSVYDDYSIMCEADAAKTKTDKIMKELKGE